MLMNWNFSDYKKSLLKSYFDIFPYLASYCGLEDYYTTPDEISESKMKEIKSFINAFRMELENNRYSLRTANDNYNADIILWNLNRTEFHFFIDNDYENNPFAYFGLLDYSVFLKLTHKEPDFIARCIKVRLDNYKNILSFMQNNLIKAPVPSLDVFEGSLQGLAQSIRTDLFMLAEKCLSEETKAGLLNSVDSAVSVLESMTGFIRDLKVNNSNPSSIGEERLKRLIYYYELKDEDLSALLKRGEEELEKCRKRLMEIKPGLSCHDVYRHYFDSHPDEGEVLHKVEYILSELSAFIRERDIIDLYDTDTLKVKKTPAYLEWASAMMSTPGPFIKEKLDSYYYITLPRKDWNDRQRQEFLKNFNHYLLENLSVHEALPGHFLHSTYERRIDDDIIKISYGYGFSEGWAHYCEEMMLEEGFRRGDPGGELAKIREQMLRLVRLISSVRIHTGKMSLEESQIMFYDMCYLDNETARQEALRAVHDPGYLLYTYGKWKIMELRESAGGRKNLKAFHKSLLSLGCPPIGLMEKYYGKIKHF